VEGEEGADRELFKKFKILMEKIFFNGKKKSNGAA